MSKRSALGLEAGGVCAASANAQSVAVTAILNKVDSFSTILRGRGRLVRVRLCCRLGMTGCTVHCEAHLRRQLADPSVADLPEAGSRFDQISLEYGGNILGPGRGAAGNPVSPAGKKTCVGAPLWMLFVSGTANTVSARSLRFRAFKETMTTGRFPFPGGSVGSWTNHISPRSGVLGIDGTQAGSSLGNCRSANSPQAASSFASSVESEL